MRRSRGYFSLKSIFFEINLCKRIKRIPREIDNNNLSGPCLMINYAGL